MKAGKWKSAAVVFLVGMVLVHAVALWQLRGYILRGYTDFAAFYTAGKIVRSGQGARLYDRSLQWEVQQGFASTVEIRRGPLPYIHPPFEVLVFFVLIYLSFLAACIVWMTVKILILASIPFLLRSHVPADQLLPLPLLELLCLAFFPVATDLMQGQDSILVLLCVTLCWMALQRKRDFRAGLFLGLGLVRFHLVIPLSLIFLLRRKTKVFGVFLTMASALFLVSMAVVGWKGLLSYPAYLFSLNRASNVGVVTPESMPNLRAVVTIVFARAPIALFVPIAISGMLLAAWFWPRNDRDPQLLSAGFSLTLAITLLTSYYAYSYDMNLLLIPILLLSGTVVRGVEVRGWTRALFLASVAVLLFSPLFWFLALGTGQFYAVAAGLLLATAISLAGMIKQWTVARFNSPL
jgi:hypothetical protein